MADIGELVREIKRAAVGAVEAGKPCGVFFGTVKSASPLEILVEQKLTLTAGQLILTRAVTDFDTEITVEWETQTAQLHTHPIKGRKKIKVHNALEVGERVALIRLAGGQKYLVADRVGD